MNVRAITTAGMHARWSDRFHDLRNAFVTSRIVPLLIVSSFAGIMAQVEYSATSYAVAARLGEPPDWMDALMVIQWTASFFSQFIVWIGCAAIAHLMAVIFDGRGTFRDLLFLWGYGYVPLALSAYFLFTIVSPSLGLFTETALSSTPDFKSIPGLSLAHALSAAAQLALAAWGSYCIVLIHKLSFPKALLCLALPCAFFLILRMLFQRII